MARSVHPCHLRTSAARSQRVLCHPKSFASNAHTFDPEYTVQYCNQNLSPRRAKVLCHIVLQAASNQDRAKHSDFPPSAAEAENSRHRVHFLCVAPSSGPSSTCRPTALRVMPIAHSIAKVPLRNALASHCALSKLPECLVVSIRCASCDTCRPERARRPLLRRSNQKAARLARCAKSALQPPVRLDSYWKQNQTVSYLCNQEQNKNYMFSLLRSANTVAAWNNENRLANNERSGQFANARRCWHRHV